MEIDNVSERADLHRELKLETLLNNSKIRLSREADEIRLAEVGAKQLKGEERSMALSAIQRRKDRLRLDQLGLDEGFAELARRNK